MPVHLTGGYGIPLVNPITITYQQQTQGIGNTTSLDSFEIFVNLLINFPCRFRNICAQRILTDQHKIGLIAVAEVMICLFIIASTAILSAPHSNSLSIKNFKNSPANVTEKAGFSAPAIPPTFGISSTIHKYNNIKHLRKTLY
jgi:hypothetical protein